ncbi:MAG TPA: hypothetical protein VMH80_22465 [Bryobacteraceae bacterium]|nr:hypothetical protein [Bryobacteraceae bacterium]
MTEIKTTEVTPLRLDNVYEILKSAGPCLTLLLPAYRPGAQAKSMAAIIKTDLQEAGKQLRMRKIPETGIVDLLAPLEHFTEEEDFLAGTRCGRVVFRSPQVLRQFELTGPVSQALHVGASFYIRPLLNELHLPPEYYVLKLSKKRISLLRGAHLRAMEISLPKTIPANAEEVLEFEPPDHDLKNRSVVKGSVGQMGGVTFGTGSDHERQHTYLADFYKAVDRGLNEFLHLTKPPLVLAGVVEDAAAYRNISSYPNLLEQGIEGSPSGSISEEDLVQRALIIVQGDCDNRAAAELFDSRERVSPARFSTSFEKILHAAIEGRVHRLYLDESAKRFGAVPEVKRGGPSNWGDEDLLNLAAVETILQRGLVFSLPSNKMPDGAAAAAVLRF